MFLSSGYNVVNNERLLLLDLNQGIRLKGTKEGWTGRGKKDLIKKFHRESVEKLQGFNGPMNISTPMTDQTYFKE